MCNSKNAEIFVVRSQAVSELAKISVSVLFIVIINPVLPLHCFPQNFSNLRPFGRIKNIALPANVGGSHTCTTLKIATIT